MKQLAPVIELASHETRQRRDPLTGLPDRRVLDHWPTPGMDVPPAGALRAVLWINVDGLTEVNDVAGFEIGDELLVQFTSRLLRCVRAGDVLVRIGGDEFALALAGNNAKTAAAVGQRIVHAAAEPFLIRGESITVGASVGLGLADGRRAAQSGAPAVGQLLTLSCAAMRQAKDLGRGRLSRLLDTDPAADAVAERGYVGRRIRPALAEGRFDLHYQPLFQVTTGELAEVEALLRWNDAELGPVSPARFIPIAEHTGQIIPLGRWALREACRQARHWQDTGCQRTVAVNLSPLQLADPRLVCDVEDALADNGLSADVLRLEITESEAIRDFEGTTCRLSQLRDLGVHLSLDDFGTGYSSLAMLRQLPVDTIKIDRSFVSRLDRPACHADSVLVGAVIDTAHAFGLKVVAEGVERPTQMIALADMGCDLVQGFLLGRPEPA